MVYDSNTHNGSEIVVAEAPAALAPTTADELAAAWLLGYRGATRAAYATDLRAWAAWLERYGIEVLSAHRAHVDAYARSLEQEGLSPASIARKLSALSGFYAYAADEGLVMVSPLRRVRRPRPMADSPTLGLDGPELGRFLVEAERSGRRDHALACLLALNGLRISEALGADVEHLGEQRGHRTLEVERKGGRRATVPLAPRTAAAIDAYLDGRGTGPLFATASGNRLDRHAARKVVQRLARTAGITKGISPHSLRHSFVTAALDAGASLRDVQDAAGHGEPRTTRRYGRARHNLDRQPTYAVAAHVAAS